MNKSERLEWLFKKALQQIADYSISLLDIDGTFLAWNKGAVQMEGYEPNEIIGLNLNTLHQLKDRKAQLADHLISSARKEGRVKHIGKRLRKDGSTFWASVVINAICDDNGEVVGFARLARELRDHELE